MPLHSASKVVGPWILKRSWCNIVPDNLPALHHKLDALQFGDIGQRVPGDGDQIGVFTLVDRTDAILPTQRLGIDRGGALDGARRGQSAVLYQRLQFETLRSM